MRIHQGKLTTQTHVGQDDLLAEDIERLLRGKHLAMTAHLDYDRQESQGSGNELSQISYSVSFPPGFVDITHQVLPGSGSNRCQHVPYALDEALQLRELVGVLERVELGDLANGSSDLLQRSWRLVLVLSGSASKTKYSVAHSLDTHVALEFLALPGKVLPEPPVACIPSRRAHEGVEILLEERREIL